MNIPEDISAALSRRTRLAIELNNADYVVSKFIDTNKIEVENYDYFGGCETYVNPHDSEKRVRDAIKKHKGA